MKYSAKSPCDECPFRVKSIPGWLGPDKDGRELAKEVLGRTEVQPGIFVGTEPMDFACHKDTARLIEQHEATTGEACYGEVPEGRRDDVQHCVGALLFLKAHCKRPHNREKSDAMDRAVETPGDPIFKKMDDFVAHHSQTKKRKKK